MGIGLLRLIGLTPKLTENNIREKKLMAIGLRKYQKLKLICFCKRANWAKSENIRKKCN